MHRTTSAKTRATATLRQLHIPPNVTSNFGQKLNKYLFPNKETYIFVENSEL